MIVVFIGENNEYGVLSGVGADSTLYFKVADAIISTGLYLQRNPNGLDDLAVRLGDAEIASIMADALITETPSAGKDYVYLCITPTHKDVIKVGYTTRPYERMGELQKAWDVENITPIAWIDVKDGKGRRLEKLLLSKFKKYCAFGEWHYSPPILEWLKKYEHNG